MTALVSADTLFLAANAVALWGWIALIASPLIPVWSNRIAAVLIPLLLSVAYTIMAALFFFGDVTIGDGGYMTLDAVQTLFSSKEAVLVGWLHVLAFDLFVGAWIVRTGRAEGVPFGVIVLCLIPTFLFGPAGFFLFHILRRFTARAPSAA
ncbi:MAG: ABA4-like family protein [Pseudomonadota bacterium]